jgi:regulatory protein
MNICCKSEKCAFDLNQKLSEWGVNNVDAERIIQKLIAERFIDDRRYAEAYVRDKFRFNDWGRIKIGFMLRNKRIPSEIIHLAMEEINEEDYFLKLKELISAKLKTVKSSDKYETKAKLYRFAQSKGFESDIIEKVLHSLTLNEI